MENISFIGIGRLGLCSALCFEKSGFSVLGCDVSEKYINELNSKMYKSFEPKVEEYLQKATNFKATTDLMETLNFSDFIFIVVPTPNGDSGYDHSILSSLLNNINKTKIKGKNFIICCTVMPGYIKNIGNYLIKDCLDCSLSYNPEFIAQGSIIDNFENPDIVLIGSAFEDIANQIKSLYQKMLRCTPRYCLLKPIEAEITKISLNGFITTKIAYANMIGDLCYSFNCDPKKVLESIGSDSRVGNKYFKYGYSYGGPCFPRDTKALSLILKKQNIYNDLIEATQSCNEKHTFFQVDQLVSSDDITFIRDLTITNVIIDGICYKGDSQIPIITESPKLKIALALSKLGYHVYIKDYPQLIEEVKKEYGNEFYYIEK